MYSITPVGGAFTESASITVSGFFYPGFDGLKSSARCKFGDQQSTPNLLEAKDGIIVCESPLRAARDVRGVERRTKAARLKTSLDQTSTMPPIVHMTRRRESWPHALRRTMHPL